jgi:hypothetical protein
MVDLDNTLGDRGKGRAGDLGGLVDGSASYVRSGPVERRCASGRVPGASSDLPWETGIKPCRVHL